MYQYLVDVIVERIQAIAFIYHTPIVPYFIGVTVRKKNPVDDFLNNLIRYLLSSEFKKLGKNLEMNIKSAWHSKQRRELEDQVGEGLNKLVQGVDKLYKKSQEKDFDKKVKSGLFKAVKKANIKLEQVHDKWEPRQENKK